MRIVIRFPFRLALSLLVVCVRLQSVSVGADTGFEAAGSTVWKYLDDGSEPDAAWRQPGFDDSKWKAGKAPLGYGETRLKTLVRFGTDAAHKHVTTWFRSQIEVPDLKFGENLILSLCVDDGAVVYLNGEELDRVNMPKGRIRAGTLALQAIDPSNEGFYVRLKVPPGRTRPHQQNILAVEVHQAAVTSSDLFLDVMFKISGAHAVAPEIADAAWEVTNTYHKKHYVGPGVKIPDGYVDGGRYMVIDPQRHAKSDREILRVDHSGDFSLAADLAFSRSSELRALPILERVQRIAAQIDRETTPPGGSICVERTVEQLEKEFKNQSISIGDWVNQGHAGVCRHRALLFKILADEAGLATSLVRGNYAEQGSPSLPHAWNEVLLDDGRRVLVDVSLEGSQPRFLELTTPDVIQHYLKVDNTPWYGSKAD
jgi:hypothetical protein